MTHSNPPPTRPHGIARSDEFVERLDRPMAALGVLFGLLVLVETVTRPTGDVAAWLSAASWLLWAAFALEFVVRAALAGSTVEFLRRNWWQVIFLVVPFLRFVRVLRATRAARVGRVVSSVVRTTRTASGRLTSRIGWAAVVTACVIVGGSQLVYELGAAPSYGDALYRVSLATIVGEPIGSSGAVKVLDVVFALYSVVFFAALAASFGSFLLERGDFEALAGTSAGEGEPQPPLDARRLGIEDRT